MNIINIIIYIILLSIVSTAYNNPILKYNPKECFPEYAKEPYYIYRSNGQVPPLFNKILKSVHKYEGARATLVTSFETL